MIEWISLGVYILGYLAFAPALARILARVLSIKSEPTKEDRVIGAIFALMAAFFWPLLFPLGWIYRRAFGTSKKENS